VIEKRPGFRSGDDDGERAFIAEAQLSLRRQAAVRLAKQMVRQIGGAISERVADVLDVAAVPVSSGLGHTAPVLSRPLFWAARTG
jgi:hypothetical protein